MKLRSSRFHAAVQYWTTNFGRLTLDWWRPLAEGK